MPNMLAHLGMGSLVTRCFDPSADTKWIYLGCLIPDVPWILQRLLRVLPIAVDSYELKLYTTSQATLAGCLLLSAAMAIISASPRRVFLILAGNSALHLLLDGCQTKWGGGVHFLAPLSWTPLSLELFWPESIGACGLTVFGLVYCIRDLFRRKSVPIGLEINSSLRTVAGLALLLAYATIVPLSMASGAFDANCHFARTLMDVDERPGRQLELDRARFRSDSSATIVTTFSGEDLRMSIATVRTHGKVSIQGEFIDEQTVDVLAHHEHWPILRDVTSVLGIGIVLYAWCAYLWTDAKRTWRRGQPIQNSSRPQAIISDHAQQKAD